MRGWVDASSKAVELCFTVFAVFVFIQLGRNLGDEGCHGEDMNRCIINHVAGKSDVTNDMIGLPCVEQKRRCEGNEMLLHLTDQRAQFTKKHGMDVEPTVTILNHEFVLYNGSFSVAGCPKNDAGEWCRNSIEDQEGLTVAQNIMSQFIYCECLLASTEYCDVGNGGLLYFTFLGGLFGVVLMEGTKDFLDSDWVGSNKQTFLRVFAWVWVLIYFVVMAIAWNGYQKCDNPDVRAAQDVVQTMSVSCIAVLLATMGFDCAAGRFSLNQKKKIASGSQTKLVVEHQEISLDNPLFSVTDTVPQHGPSSTNA
eukprot:m.177758 g.177758  ORF g.177758 m.177758 type:complete len:310 (-) comp17970_c0_seq4:1481-2410(-)